MGFTPDLSLLCIVASEATTKKYVNVEVEF